MNFVLLDLTLLVLFTIFVFLFLRKRKKNLQREGLLYLYRTKLGISFIEKFTKKFSKILRPLEYVVITSGFILMIGAAYLIFTTVYIYLTTPQIAEVIKAPPVFPIFPYFTKFFGLSSFFPDFYFIYFVIVIAIVAISHEFAHGIFARLNKVKIHSTGFAFLGPFLGAFVEQDEKQMNRTSKFSQMAILAAGTFANVLMAILFGLILWLFFATAFVPNGIYFTSYATSSLPISESIIGDNVTIQEMEFIQIFYKNKTYFTTQSIIEYSKENNLTTINSIDDSPALNSGMKIGEAITEVSGKKIDSYDSLSDSLKSYSPGDFVTINTIDKQGLEKSYTIKLTERDGKSFLGIGIAPLSNRGFSGFLASLVSKIKDPRIHYQSNIGEYGMFIYNLLWWTVILNILVALMNMLPLGIFDGGRFFYLTIWGITKKENAGKIAYKISTWFFLLLILALMIKWALTFL